MLSQDAGPISLSGIDTRVVDDSLFEQHQEFFTLGADQGHLLLLGGKARFHAFDFFTGLNDAELELFLLALPREPVAVEQARLSMDDQIGSCRERVDVGKCDRLQALAFRNQSCLAPERFCQLRFNDEQLRLDLNVVEGGKDLPFLDQIALPHGEGLDDAAITVLNFLEILIHLDRASGYNRAFKLGQCRPAAAPDNQANRQHDPGHDTRPQGKSILLASLAGVLDFGFRNDPARIFVLHDDFPLRPVNRLSTVVVSFEQVMPEHLNLIAVFGIAIRDG